MLAGLLFAIHDADDRPAMLTATLPFGGVSLLVSVWLGILIVIIALVVLAVLGRRRQSRAAATRAAGPGGS